MWNRMWNRMWAILDECFPLILFIGVILFLALGVGMAASSLKQQHVERDRFMAECLQDHKQYECTALWRAGERGVVSAVPVVIPHSHYSR